MRTFVKVIKDGGDWVRDTGDPRRAPAVICDDFVIRWLGLQHAPDGTRGTLVLSKEPFEGALPVALIVTACFGSAPEVFWGPKARPVWDELGRILVREVEVTNTVYVKLELL